MLWYKGWLETRWRLLYTLVFGGYSMFMLHRGSMNTLGLGRFGPGRLLDIFAVIWMIVPIMLAGSGIKTQAAFRALKGLHGSMLYTLTLPVSRLRLILVRTGLGMTETAGVFVLISVGVWLLSPSLKASATVVDVLENALAITICSTVVYFISVLTSTFLDDIWQILSSVLTVAVLSWLAANISWLSSVNIFRAMGSESPLVTHAMPWASMGVSLCGAAILLWVAVKVAEAREY